MRRFASDTTFPEHPPVLRLRDLTIRTRLTALVIISTVALAALLGLSAYVIHTYRVEGPVHTELQLSRQLLTEMEPSVLALGARTSSFTSLTMTADPADLKSSFGGAGGLGGRLSRAVRRLEGFGTGPWDQEGGSRLSPARGGILPARQQRADSAVAQQPDGECSATHARQDRSGLWKV